MSDKTKFNQKKDIEKPRNKFRNLSTTVRNKLFAGSKIPEPGD